MKSPDPNDVLITGLGVVSPIGIGHEAVWESLAARQSGVRDVPRLREAGWVAPFGGSVRDFEPKKLIKPRKSLKVMSWDIQLACGAAELAWQDAGIPDGHVDAGRIGVVVGAPGFIFCELEELRPAYQQWFDTSKPQDIYRWGKAAMSELFPLWMLKYLPNLAGCHVGIRLDARGPTNTIGVGDPSSLLALAEASDVIRRGAADVMVVGGTGSNLTETRMVWHAGAGLARSDGDPATVCRPFDQERSGMVYGEGAGSLVLERRSHAQRRGARVRARVLAAACRLERSPQQVPTGDAIARAIRAALRSANLEPGDLGHVNAHGNSTEADDRAEAEAIHQILPSVPVTAPKSFFGNLGPGSGLVELIVSLIALERGQLPPTLNYEHPDPSCPIDVISQPRPAKQPTLIALNHSPSGQTAAVILDAE